MRKRKLIEVAMPLEAISAASGREKSIRHGHPSTLHLWWARRPLAACRAVLFAQLVDDPSSHPERFPTEEAVNVERDRLFGIMRELVLWKNSVEGRILNRAREEIWNSCGGNLPRVCDAFSGGVAFLLRPSGLGFPLPEVTSIPSRCLSARQLQNSLACSKTGCRCILARASATIIEAARA